MKEQWGPIIFGMMLCLFAFAARAAQEELSWYTVDGGGTMECTGGDESTTYELSGTVVAFGRMLFCKLFEAGVRGKVWQSIRSVMRNVRGQVRIDDTISEPFSQSVGVAQGAVESCILFNIFVNDLAQHLREALPDDEGVTVFEERW